MYARYVDAAKKQFLQGKQKAQNVAASAADKKVNMAVTKEDSIFPNIHLPGGISSKATEYKELARKGDKWESPVFKLGSASTSSSIPGATKITRKDHRVTGGGVRGNQNIGNTGSMTDRAANYSGDNTNGGAYSNGGVYSNGGGYTNGNTNGNQNGFRKEVDQAFSRENAPMTGNGHNTSLGANNPVLTGRS